MAWGLLGLTVTLIFAALWFQPKSGLSVIGLARTPDVLEDVSRRLLDELDRQLDAVDRFAAFETDWAGAR